MGSRNTCHSGLVGREKRLLILSFAEDEDGKTFLYIGAVEIVLPNLTKLRAFALSAQWTFLCIETL